MFDGWAETISKGLNYLFLLFEFPQHFGRIIGWTLSQRSLPRELIRLKKYAQWFKNRDFKTILDVGANAGPFAFAARSLLPAARIYAFEPLPDCHRRLEENLSPLGNFQAFRTAIGNQRGEIEMWKSEFSESSSILAMGDLHKMAFPHTASANSIKVPISRLDDFIEQILFTPPVLLKIDVQGYEDHVILGAEKVMKKVDCIIIEISFQPLYKGQALFGEIYQLLNENGFHFEGFMDSLLSPKDGSVLQSDGIFYRK